MKHFNTLPEVLNFIETRTNFDLGIKRVQQFITHTNLSIDHIKTIHVGGTNGKGSVTNYLVDALIANDLQVGMFSSPSILCHNERIKINQQMIPDQAIIAFMNQYYELIVELKLSMFEIDVVMAFAYFIENNVDIIVLEVGLGGRYDGTNVVTPLISVITNVSIDHEQYLGTTIEEITMNKAGIIKPNVPLFTGASEYVSLLLKQECLKLNAPYFHTSVYPYKLSDCITINHPIFNDVLINTTALYQASNVSLVLDVLAYLTPVLNLDLQKVKQGLAKSQWIGRFQKIHGYPMIIVDGAHNIDGIQALKQSLSIYNQSKITCLFSALSDKEYQAMIDILKDSVDQFYVTTFDFYRALKKDQLPTTIPYIENYLEFIHDFKTKNNDEVLIITGSLYFISEVLKDYHKK